MAAYDRRSFAGAAAATTLNGGINNSVTALTLTSASGWPDTSGGSFVAVIDEGTASEEKILVGALSGTSASSITRGYDGTSAATHASGAAIRHVIGKVDVDEANLAVSKTIKLATAVGQILVADAANSFAAVQTKTSGQILVGNGTTLASVAVSGDVTLASNGAVTIGNDAITNAKMANNAVDTAELAANAVTSAKITDGTIVAGDLASDAVTTVKILDANVTAGKLATNAVTTVKITDANVTYAKLDLTAGTAAVRRVVQIQVTDPAGSALTTGDGKAYFRVNSELNNLNLIAVAAHVTTVSSSGLPTIQIANVTDTVDMLSTKITIDANEKDSSSAATAAVIDTSKDDVQTGDELRIDVDVAGTGAKGLIVEMVFG